MNDFKGKCVIVLLYIVYVKILLQIFKKFLAFYSISC